MAARIGLVVNPVAGLGGALGLKGTDGPEILAAARARGAVPAAGKRAGEALAILAAGLGPPPRIVTAAGAMGADIAAACGLPAEIVAAAAGAGETGPEDTRNAAAAIAAAGVDLLLFAGGDGTARDLYAALGETVPVVGIPAGVKMHSGVFATNPRAAGELVLQHLRRGLPVRPVEVMDIDEAAWRAGAVNAQLYGFMAAPYDRALSQGVKAGRVNGDLAAVDAVAAEVVDALAPGRLYILGPGTTTRAIARRLGQEKTLLGVDLLRDGRIIARDLDAAGLLAATEGQAASIVVTPIGGQGHILGRGNQQIAPALLRRLGREALIIVATPGKLASLQGRPLRVDTGDAALDAALAGHYRVVTGYRLSAICPVTA